MSDTLVKITQVCGHETSVDLGTRKPFERESFLKWLRGKQCRVCDPKEQKKRQAFLDERRRQEDETAREAEKAFGFTPLNGPPKALAWATRVRVAMVAAAWQELGLDEAEFDRTVGKPAGEVDAATWWLDHRDTTSESLPALLAAALGEPGVADGNPF
ncbi:hypothetical protein HF995_13410 [Sanguibacter hominis ATCC BAA-789]|uniref:Uncharacterized protein n=1 Tax=Sanguibacter hominis ATCC BAA-789 TaxID=1312740 RepID=A0A9X5FDQ1_9MICO|nr:hypothetical protein [Sanguibacter hominis]NKX94254.1 hypothetical protein [Sanguibacter hominis ATCC BAA-789]